MNRFFYTAAILTGFLVSCSSNEKKIISVEKHKMYTPAATVHANRQLNIEVSGMSCVHACGGAIRTALKETNAVERVSFDFQENRKTNTAFITFDKSKINVDQIIAIIEKINNKQFTTGKANSEDLQVTTTPAAHAETETHTTSKPQVEVSSTAIEFPSLYELFSRIIS
jgi:copper chaperone CopZ